MDIKMKKPIEIALIGAGQRGEYAYAPYAQQYPSDVKIIAIAEPRQKILEVIAGRHNVPPEGRFSTGEDLLAANVKCDAILLCTQDAQHFNMAMDILDRGYNLLLEKPMAVTPQECVLLGKKAEEKGVVFAISHVLRYTPFFETIKRLLIDGRIGKLQHIHHSENIGYFHFAHSYVRGNWRKEKESSPMILSKCCHDMDILQWLADSECETITSYGDLSYFKAENAPGDVPNRCIDGCPYEQDCPYSAVRFYMGKGIKYGFTRIITGNDERPESIMKALQEGPYGRCVFRCDNDVVDHQATAIVFKNGVTATFDATAFSGEIYRSIKLQGTLGEITGNTADGKIKVVDFRTNQVDCIQIPESDSGHGGGDFGLMRAFVKAVSEHNAQQMLTSAKPSVHSHLMSFAAEKSRVTGESVNMQDYEASLV